MPTILQLRRGTDSQNNSFIGAAGELTFDTSNNTIRAHDGNTQGGHRLVTINDLSAVGVDSSQVANIVDSAYIQARQSDIFRDSDFVTNIVDEIYIQARDRVRDSSFIVDIVDSDFVQSRQTLSTYGDSNVQLLVDSAYIQARQADIFRDSAFITQIVDSAYIQEKVGGAGGLDSSQIVDLITTNVTSNYITGLNVSADSLDGLDGTAFVRSDVDDEISGNITFDDDAILKFGNSGVLEISYNSGAGVATISNTTNQEMALQADTIRLVSRTGEQYLRADANGRVSLSYDNNTRLQTDNDGLVIFGSVIPKFNGFYSLGSSSKRWKDLWVTGQTIFIGNASMSVDSGGSLSIATIDSDGNVLEAQGTIDPKNLDNAISVELDSNGQQSIDQFNKNSFRTARYIIQIEANNSFHSTEILLMHNDTEVFMTEYAVLRTDSALGDITADISGDNIRLLITPSYSTTNIKAKRLIIDA